MSTPTIPIDEEDGAALSVAYVCPGWPPSAFPNGIVSYVEAIAEGMRTLGHRPLVLARRIAEGDGGDGADSVIDLARFSAPDGPVARLRDRLAALLGPETARGRATGRSVRRGLSRLSAADGPNLVEMEESFGWAASVSGRVPMPVVVRLHGPWFLNGPNNGADPDSDAFRRRVAAEGLGLRAADAVSAPSLDVLERTRAAYGLALPDAEVIPNPTPRVPPDLHWRPEDAEPELVLFIGRFDRHKGGDTIIDAFARLLRDRPTARLLFVGPDRGLVRDGRRWSLPEYVEHRLPGALRDGRVSWLGPRPRNELDGLRRRAAVTVVASRYDVFALTISEAMAAGCPLVATRAGGAGEVFEHGVSGLYREPDDPEGLADAIATLLADPALSSALGRAASDLCERRYAPEVVAARTAAFYRLVLTRASGRAAGPSTRSRPR